MQIIYPNNYIQQDLMYDPSLFPAWVNPSKGRQVNEVWSRGANPELNHYNWQKTAVNGVPTIVTSGSANLSARISSYLTLGTGADAAGTYLLTQNVTGIQHAATHKLWFRTYFRIEDLSTVATQEFYNVFGFANSSTAAVPTKGIYFYYNKATSSNWLCVIKGTGGTSTLDSSVPVTEDTWDSFRIDVEGTTSVKFYINDVIVQTYASATNVPTGSGDTFQPELKISKLAGTTTRTVHWAHTDIVRYTG